MAQKEKIEKKLEKNLQEIFNDLVGGELEYEKIIDRIFDWVIWDMRKYQGYNYERITRCFFKRMYADNQSLYMENEDFITSRGRSLENPH